MLRWGACQSRCPTCGSPWWRQRPAGCCRRPPPACRGQLGLFGERGVGAERFRQGTGGCRVSTAQQHIHAAPPHLPVAPLVRRRRQVHQCRRRHPPGTRARQRRQRRPAAARAGAQRLRSTSPPGCPPAGSALCSPAAPPAAGPPGRRHQRSPLGGLWGVGEGANESSAAAVQARPPSDAMPHAAAPREHKPSTHPPTPAGSVSRRCRRSAWPAAGPFGGRAQTRATRGAPL